MQIVVDDAYLPATFTAAPMTDEEFANFCSEYPDYLVEMSVEGELFIMPPNYSLTGLQNQKINTQLDTWASITDFGFATEASTGFRLPNGARRSPDAAWTRGDRILALEAATRKKFWPLCPDFVIELKTQTDRPSVIRKKMHEWISNGAQLGWLIDPERRTVEIYSPDCEPETLDNPNEVIGEGPVQGFVLRMKKVWDPLGF